MTFSIKNENFFKKERFTVKKLLAVETKAVTFTNGSL